MDYRGRLEPCHLLLQNEIPCTIWFEDAIGFYGVPTVVFDLYLLVPDIEKATRVLGQDGWIPAPNRPSDVYNFLSEASPSVYRRLAPPGFGEKQLPRAWPPPPPRKRPSTPDVTVLLPAADWGLTVEQLCQSPENGFIPPLARLADSLIGSLLDSSDGSRIQLHVSCQVSYLYAHVSQLKEKSFAADLKHEHRQFHLDCLAGMAVGTIPFIVHERQIREALKRGEWAIRDCSTTRTESNKILFGGCDIDPTTMRLLQQPVEGSPTNRSSS